MPGTSKIRATNPTPSFSNNHSSIGHSTRIKVRSDSRKQKIAHEQSLLWTLLSSPRGIRPLLGKSRWTMTKTKMTYCTLLGVWRIPNNWNDLHSWSNSRAKASRRRLRDPKVSSSPSGNAGTTMKFSILREARFSATTGQKLPRGREQKQTSHKRARAGCLKNRSHLIRK